MSAQTLDVTLGRADGFLPVSTVIHVALNQGVETFSSVCLPFDTVSNFFTALTGSSQSLCVEGTYDPTTTTLTATQIKFEDPSGVEGGVVEANGSVLTSPGIDPVHGTFTLGPTTWSGTVLFTNETVYVATNGQTQYMDQQLSVDETTFFSLLTIGATGIRAVGPIDPVTHTLTATLLWFDAP